MRISAKFGGALALTTALVLGAVVDVNAQGRRDAVVIEITKTDNACRYQVEDVAGEILVTQQDTFLVNAGGFLHVTTTGTSARVEIKDDTEKNVKGFKGSGVAALEAGGSAFLQVRAPRRQNPGSLHRVAIDCCESVDEQGNCENPVPSDKMSSVESSGERINRASLGTPLDKMLRLMFGAKDPDHPPVGSGGPDMDVNP